MNICADCEAKWEDDEVNFVKDLFMRVLPGDEMPSGECPACGALTYQLGDPMISVLENRWYAAERMAMVIIKEYELNGCQTMYGPAIDFLYIWAKEVLGKSK